MILALIAALTMQVPANPEPVGTQIDMPLQDVILPTIDGQKSVRLSDLRGKPMLLIQFASW
ncbi:MAG: hypothetical protein P1V35_16710 [Planctomycetota bacterium]|nr:hypothetical protein [Planctomycetota bacterium]